MAVLGGVSLTQNNTFTLASAMNIHDIAQIDTRAQQRHVNMVRMTKTRGVSNYDIHYRFYAQASI